MSFKLLPKQLPSGHIAERRFIPYKKANIFIKHFEMAQKARHNIDFPMPSTPCEQSFINKLTQSPTKQVNNVFISSIFRRNTPKKMTLTMRRPKSRQ